MAKDKLFKKAGQGLDLEFKPHIKGYCEES
jgi:hypothetical protein